MIKFYEEDGTIYTERVIREVETGKMRRADNQDGDGGSKTQSKTPEKTGNTLKDDYEAQRQET